MISKSKAIKLTLGAALVLALSSVTWLSLRSAQTKDGDPGSAQTEDGDRGSAQTKDGDRGGAIALLLKDLPENLSDLGKSVETNYREYRANAFRWSAVYYGCLFGAAFLSACAGVLLKLESWKQNRELRNDLAAIMAALASLLITLLTVGSFEEKWRSNRVAASGMENLAYDLVKLVAPKETNAILTRIQEINEARNSGIVGAAPLAEREPIGDKTSKMEAPDTPAKPVTSVDGP